MMNRIASALLVIAIGTWCNACTGSTSPAGPSATGLVGLASQAVPPWGPETPPFNLEVILRSVGQSGFGHVTFRQPNDERLVIELDTWVRDLLPNTSYLLQRAADANPDGVCTSTSWLTLGKGAVPQAITTDDKGTGREELFRDVSAFPVGSTFDIHFRVIQQATSAVVLQSDCYQYAISQ